MTDPTRRPAVDDRGVTLVELMVTITILAVVMLAMATAAILIQRSANETDQRFDDLAQARLAMDATTRWLRGATTIPPRSDPFWVARRDEVEFISDVAGVGDADPERVELKVVNGDELRERVWVGDIRPNGRWRSVGAPRDRIVARGVTNGDQLFRFYDPDGAELDPGSGNLHQDLRELVFRVEVDYEVQQAPNLDVAPAELTNTVRLPNQSFLDHEDDFNQ